MLWLPCQNTPVTGLCVLLNICGFSFYYSLPQFFRKFKSPEIKLHKLSVQFAQNWSCENPNTFSFNFTKTLFKLPIYKRRLTNLIIHANGAWLMLQIHSPNTCCSSSRRRFLLQHHCENMVLGNTNKCKLIAK